MEFIEMIVRKKKWWNKIYNYNIFNNFYLSFINILLVQTNSIFLDGIWLQTYFPFIIISNIA
jgi:hypothetical protein